MTNKEIAEFFNNARLQIQGNPNLGDPEVKGWFRAPSSVKGPLMICHVEKTDPRLNYGRGDL